MIEEAKRDAEQQRQKALLDGRARAQKMQESEEERLRGLYDEYRDPNYSPVPLLRRMVTAELLGRKSGKGFYDYHR